MKSNLPQSVIFQTIFLLFCGIIGHETFGQQGILDLEESLNRNQQAHGSFKPVLVDTIKYYPDLNRPSSKFKFVNSLIYKHYLEYNDRSGVHIFIDPILNLQAGYDLADPINKDTLFYTNTRGVKIAGSIGSKFTFSSAIYENQSRFPGYIDKYVANTGASVGLGRTKKFKSFGYDYSMSSGMINYKPTRNAEIWFGQGKNFVGVGYRSLLLSDHSMNYPHLRLAYSFLQGKLKYQTTFASLSTGYRYSSFSSTEPSFISKGASFHYLSYQPTQSWEIGIFESTMWQRYSQGKQLAVNPLQFNPLLGINAFGGLNTPSRNGLFGLQVSHHTAKNWKYYGQAMFDGTKKNGLQLGISKQNLLLNGLFVRLEFNTVSKGAYASSDSLLGYTQFRQTLAHPMGSGFSEIVTTINYRFRRLVVNLQTSMAKYQAVTALPGFYVAGMELAKLTNASTNYRFYQPSLSYIIHPPSNMQVKVGYLIRELTSEEKTTKTNFIFVSLCTQLTNLNFDF